MTFNEQELIKAHLTNADLSNANLSNVQFYNTGGNRKEIVTLQTEQWQINIILPTNILQIGCKQISFEEFFKLTKIKAEKIYKGSWKWIKTWRPFIKTAIKNYGVEV